MPVELLTQKDIEPIKQLLEEIWQVVKQQQPQAKHVRSSEARKLLACSTGHLHNLRVTGILPATRIGKLWYFKTSDIERLLSEGNGK